MNSPLICNIVRDLSTPLEPIPTSAQPRLARLEGIAAVLFDVYGTLLVSGSGDIGAHAEESAGAAFTAAFDAAGVPFRGDGTAGVELLQHTIRSRNQQRRLVGVDDPEIDIINVWRDVVAQLGHDGHLDAEPDDGGLRQLAVEYECRVNPVWPMPGAGELLQRLHHAELRLGLISNAQFFTPLILEELFGTDLQNLGFTEGLQFFSYRFLRAKPGEFLYREACETLGLLGIPPEATLYIGNDMLKDVTPAAAVGFRTALFAGDSRSLRLREDDPRVQGVTPDVTITHLEQLSECLGLE